jgi:hypothetical protein
LGLIEQKIAQAMAAPAATPPNLEATLDKLDDLPSIRQALLGQGINNLATQVPTLPRSNTARLRPPKIVTTR